MAYSHEDGRRDRCDSMLATHLPEGCPPIKVVALQANRSPRLSPTNGPKLGRSKTVVDLQRCDLRAASVIWLLITDILITIVNTIHLHSPGNELVGNTTHVKRQIT